MKKFSTLLFALALAFSAMAQLPDGSIAPNFTGTDINGVSYTLYDILDQGKPVIMDVSATWCGPCWAYHNAHHLEDLWAQHGPAGDDKVMVFYVEGDDATNTACLSGSAGCVGGTQGNWVAGTPYPIIDDYNIADAYEISYFPTIYLICPDRSVTEIGQKNAAGLWAGASQCAIQNGANNAGILKFDHGAFSTDICGTTPAAPEFRLTNMGSDPLTSAKIALKWNGTTLQSKDWTGNLNTYGFDAVQFDQIVIDQPGKLEVEITDVNNLADEDPTNNAKAVDFTAAPAFSTQKVYLKIKTDAYGAEFYWELRDDQGNTLDHGGNEAVGPDGGGGSAQPPSHPSAYGNNVTIRDTLVLPANGCYQFYAVDSYGDGLCCDYGNGYYKMYNLGNTVTAILQGDSWVNQETRPFAGSGFVGVGDLIPSEEFEVFPNPTSGSLTVDFVVKESAAVSMFVTNSIGQVVKTVVGKNYGEGFHQEAVSVSDLANGMYFLNLRTESGVASRKFTVLK